MRGETMSFHYLLMANQAIYQRKLMELLSDTGLTMGQPKILDYLSLHDGASQRDIAAYCYIEPASLTSVLNGMEKKGLIQRRRMNGNRRTFHIFLTEQGKVQSKRVEEAFGEMEAETFADFSQEQAAGFMKMLAAIYEHLNK